VTEGLALVGGWIQFLILLAILASFLLRRSG
jgi:hypothetical protein